MRADRKMFSGLGSFSTGSLLLADLIPAALSAAHVLGRFLRDSSFTGSRESLRREWSALASGDDVETEEASDLYESVCDLVNANLPTGLYFGSLEGDGADVGIFASDPADYDLPRVDDASALSDLDSDEAYVVNDHGNVTFYARRRNVWEPVWDCV